MLLFFILQLLLVDEVMRAGKQMGKQAKPDGDSEDIYE